MDHSPTTDDDALASSRNDGPPPPSKVENSLSIPSYINTPSKERTVTTPRRLPTAPNSVKNSEDNPSLVQDYRKLYFDIKQKHTVILEKYKTEMTQHQKIIKEKDSTIENLKEKIKSMEDEQVCCLKRVSSEVDMF